MKVNIKIWKAKGYYYISPDIAGLWCTRTNKVGVLPAIDWILRHIMDKIGISSEIQRKIYVGNMFPEIQKVYFETEKIYELNYIDLSIDELIKFEKKLENIEEFVKYFNDHLQGVINALRKYIDLPAIETEYYICEAKEDGWESWWTRNCKHVFLGKYV